MAYVRFFTFSVPALCIVGLFVLADFLHTMADSGFASVVRQQPGPPAAQTLDGPDTREDVLLRQGNASSAAFQTFTMTPDQKRLARDRPNWKEGRVVQGFYLIRC